MDHLIDDAAQEILLHLPLKHLIRFRVVSRRYNAMILSPGFMARHGQLHSPCASGGVFLHHRARRDQLEPLPGGGGRGTPVGESSHACFVAAASSATSPPDQPAFHDVDLAGFLPRPNARETAYLQRTTGARSDDVFIVHSSAGHGLLLCCRSPVHYYVCDPVARRFARLPELPRPPANEQISGLLSVAADDQDTAAMKQFKVILFDQRRQWDVPGGSLDLEVFSSSSGDQWTPLRVPYPPDFTSFQCSRPPLLAPSGAAAYWLGFWRSQAVAYSSADHSLRLIPVPGRHFDTNELKDRCIGERRHDGGLQYAHFNGGKLEVWETPAAAGGEQQQQLREWTLKHRAEVNDVVRRSRPGVGAFFTSGDMLRWTATNRGAYWRSVFALVGFDPADEDVLLLEASQVGRLAAYSIKQRKLSFRCHLSPGVTFAPVDVFPYVRPPRGAVEVPGMQGLDA